MANVKSVNLQRVSFHLSWHKDICYDFFPSSFTNVRLVLTCFLYATLPGYHFYSLNVKCLVQWLVHQNSELTFLETRMGNLFSKHLSSSIKKLIHGQKLKIYFVDFCTL